MKKKVIIVVITILFYVLFLSPPVRAQTARMPEPPVNNGRLFIDVDEGHWAYQPIKRLSDRNIIMGYPDGSYKPQKKVQRKEYALMLASIAGLKSPVPEEHIYADVPAGVWYGPAVAAVRLYMPGSAGQDGQNYFHPDEDAARQDVISALVKALRVNYKQVDPRILQETFMDYKQIAQDVRLQVAWAVQNNLIRGFPDGSFRPREGITRAEVAAILYRAYFVDNSIKGLIENKEVKPFSSSSPAYQNLTGLLNNKYGQLPAGAYKVEYFARDENYYDGEGLQVLYIFGRIDDVKYFRWEAEFAGVYDQVKEFNEAVALEAARMYPQKNILVMLGHTFTRYFDVSDVYDKKYLSKTGDGWRFERFYTGVLVKNGVIAMVWVEDLLNKQ